MTSNLGARSSNAPLPTGIAQRKFGRSDVGAAPAWPAAQNYILPGDGSGAEIGPFNRPERFWLHAGASLIATSAAGWSVYVYQLRLLINGAAYGPDLNGNEYFYKQNYNENHPPDGWWGHSIEGQFFCEANTTYHVRLMSGGGGTDINYYQWKSHWNMWGYTVGEGAV